MQLAVVVFIQNSCASRSQDRFNLESQLQWTFVSTRHQIDGKVNGIGTDDSIKLRLNQYVT